MCTVVQKESIFRFFWKWIRLITWKYSEGSILPCGSYSRAALYLQPHPVLFLMTLLMWTRAVGCHNPAGTNHWWHRGGTRGPRARLLCHCCVSVVWGQFRNGARWPREPLWGRGPAGQHHGPPGAGRLPPLPLVPLQPAGAEPLPPVSTEPERPPVTFTLPVGSTWEQFCISGLLGCHSVLNDSHFIYVCSFAGHWGCICYPLRGDGRCCCESHC